MHVQERNEKVWGKKQFPGHNSKGLFTGISDQCQRWVSYAC